MRNSGTCPKCQNRTLLYVPVAFPSRKIADGGGHRPDTDGVKRWYDSGFLMQTFGGMTAAGVGRVEALICERCRYVEFYYADPFPMIVDGVNVIRLVKPEEGYR